MLSVSETLSSHRSFLKLMNSIQYFISGASFWHLFLKFLTLINPGWGYSWGNSRAPAWPEVLTLIPNTKNKQKFVTCILNFCGQLFQCFFVSPTTFTLIISKVVTLCLIHVFCELVRFLYFCLAEFVQLYTYQRCSLSSSLGAPGSALEELRHNC